jgi:uncharacterized protein
MALWVNLRHLIRESKSLRGALTPAELELGVVDEMIRPGEALRYELEVQRLGQEILVQGEMWMVVDCECVRCLRPFRVEIALRPWACDLALEGEEAVTVVNDCVDLTPPIREAILLAFPQHPLCSPECRGLPEALPKGKQASGARPDDQTSSAWAALNKLKL